MAANEIEHGIINAKLDNIEVKLDKVVNTVCGNGKIGLIIEVDRLKQTHNRNVWWTRILTIPVIALVVKMIIDGILYTVKVN